MVSANRKQDLFMANRFKHSR